jgi:ribonucleotide reductase alpha subunit
MHASPNPNILSRFTGRGETWQSLVTRVASIGEQRVQGDYRKLIGEGLLVPSGQILRGARRSGAVLYNCFVTGVAPYEDAAAVATRISHWTRLGAGVGVNMDSLAARERASGASICAAIGSIACSQHQLWLEGITRTATMITLSLSDSEILAASRLLTAAEHFRHLNLGVLVSDEDLRTQQPALHALVETAWATGNPGFLFIDRVRKDHPFSDSVRACNPCGEQFLADEEGCNLASLNLAAFVSNGDFDWSAFEQAGCLAVRFLDDVIDASAFPSYMTRHMAFRRRRIGLGVLGFASALHFLDIEYGSADSVDLADRLARALRETAEAATADLARERGAFLECTDGRRRNSHLLSIAPTGAISLLWRVSSGIEPLFGNAINKGALHIDFGTFGARRPRLGSEVPAVDHIKILAAWQRHVDGGISKTINMPAQTGVDGIEAAISDARQQGCKGISIFRESSRPAAVTRVEENVA